MSIKSILAFILIIAIGVFIWFSIGYKAKERDKQIALQSGTSTENKRLVSQAKQMDKINAQAGRILDSGEKEMSGADNNQPVPATYEDDADYQIYNINLGKYYGCVEKTVLHKLLKYSAKSDLKKYNELYTSGLSTGDVTAFRPGEQVVLQETDSATGEVLVSRIGETKSYWTVHKAIE
jgi:hypothetical protein